MKKEKKTEEPEKSEKSEKKSRMRATDPIAFIALVASGILLLVGPILRILPGEMGGDVTYQVLSMIVQYSLLAVLAIPAWMFVRNKGKGWKVVYFIFLALYILGPVLGVTFGALGF